MKVIHLIYLRNLYSAMYPSLQTPYRHLTKSDFFRRNHHFSSAAAFYRKNNLLCPSSTSFITTNSTRCFSEKILKWNFVSTVFDRLTQNDYVYTVQEKLITFHDTSGLPWWAVIVTSTFAIRTLLIFPFAIHQHRVLANLSNVFKEMEIVEEEVTETVAQLKKKNQWDEKSSKSSYHCEIHDRRHELYDKHKCRPSKALTLVLIQVPVWLTMSGAIYNISSILPIHDAVATQAYLDMKATSFSVLTDLTVPDETYMLPVFVVLTNLIIIQLYRISIFPSNRLRLIALVLSKSFVLCSLAFIVFAPKCMTLYWLTSSFVGLLQNILFIFPKTRKMLRIPSTDTTKQISLTRLKNKFKSIYYFLKY